MLEGEELAREVPRRAVIPFTGVASGVSFSPSPWDQARSKIHNLLCHSPALAELAESRNKGSDQRTGNGCQCCTSHGCTAEKGREILPESL